MFPEQNNDSGLAIIFQIFTIIRILVTVTSILIIYIQVQVKRTFNFVKFFFWSVSIFYFLKWLLGEFPQSI